MRIWFPAGDDSVPVRIVVADIAARDALDTSGYTAWQQGVIVLDNGDGDEGEYIWDGSAWQIVWDPAGTVSLDGAYEVGAAIVMNSTAGDLTISGEASGSWTFDDQTAALTQVGAGVVALTGALTLGAGVTAPSGSALPLGSATVAPQWPSLTTTERNALAPSNGMGVYNETDSEGQMYLDGGWVNIGQAGGGGGATPVVVTTQQTTTDNSGAGGADSTLKFTPPEADTFYRVQVYMITDSDSATVGVHWRWEGFAGPEYINLYEHSYSHASEPRMRVHETWNTWVTELNSLIGRQVIRMGIVIKSHATTPTEMNIQFATETSGTQVSVEPGSWLEYKKME
jgi:hypothetical protein